MFKSHAQLSIWAFFFALLLSSTTAHSNDYIACPADFVSYHKDADLGGGVFYRYTSKFSDNKWRQASIRRTNEITISEFETETPIDTIFYTTAPERKNYYLVKSGKFSETFSYEKNALVGYGDALKRTLRNEFSKRFSQPPFNRDFVAEIDLEVYQRLHLSNLPSGSSLVSKSRDLFDKRKGWHLTFANGNSTFNDISARGNFAFPENIIAKNQDLKHVLEAVLQRYQGPGKACVRIYRTLGSDHSGLYVAFNNVLSNLSPVSINYILKFQ